MGIFFFLIRRWKVSRCQNGKTAESAASAERRALHGALPLPMWDRWLHAAGRHKQPPRPGLAERPGSERREKKRRPSRRC